MCLTWANETHLSHKKPDVFVFYLYVTLAQLGGPRGSRGVFENSPLTLMMIPRNIGCWYDDGFDFARGIFWWWLAMDFLSFICWFGRRAVVTSSMSRAAELATVEATTLCSIGWKVAWTVDCFLPRCEMPPGDVVSSGPWVIFELRHSDLWVSAPSNERTSTVSYKYTAVFPSLMTIQL